MLKKIRASDIGVALASFFVLIPLGFGVVGEPRPLILFFSLVPAAAILFRAAAPVASAATIYTAALVQALVLGEPLAVNLTVLAALYSVTARGPRWASVVGLLGGFIGAGMFGFMLGEGDFSSMVVFALPTGLAVIIAWALGIARRSWLARDQALQRQREAESASKFRDAELAVAEERARIAREMHDVVAHSLAVIIAQADGGRYAAKTDPQQSVKSLETISEIGRAALKDIRRILGVLRSDDGDGPLVQPQPTDDNLGEIVDQVRQTGATVAYTMIGRPRPLLPGMGLTLQRVCQEALTNSLKHAGPGAKMSVLLQWTDQRVTLQVDDDGRGAAATSDGAGTGIVGMRERAQLFNGEFQAGPRPTGGFRVRMVLPLPSSGQSEEHP